MNAPARLALDPDDLRRSLGRLVMAVLELLRQLLERQALRRMDSDCLSPAEVERLGTTLMRLAEEMSWLRRHFGLDDDDPGIDLGPLGKLF